MAQQATRDRPRRRRMVTFLERFWQRVDTRDGPGACWLWRSGRTGCGYGALYMGQPAGRPVTELAHRLAYALQHREPIPVGLTIDHLCRVRHCVNPAHLEVVTRGENVLRGTGPGARNARAAVCWRGHPFDAANTYRMANGNRMCKACHRVSNRDFARRRALAKLEAAC